MLFLPAVVLFGGGESFNAIRRKIGGVDVFSFGGIASKLLTKILALVAGGL